jgi:hypothetical protein
MATEVEMSSTHPQGSSEGALDHLHSPPPANSGQPFIRYSERRSASNLSTFFEDRLHHQSLYASSSFIKSTHTSCPSPSHPNNSSRSRTVFSITLARLRFTNGSGLCSRSRLLHRKKLSRPSRVVGPFLQDSLSACGLIPRTFSRLRGSICTPQA